MRRLPLVFATIVLTAGSIGIILSRNLIELFFCAELISVVFFFIFFSIIIPAIFPSKVNPEAIFIGGTAKSPYVHDSEFYTPKLPLLTEEEEDATH